MDNEGVPADSDLQANHEDFAHPDTDMSCSHSCSTGSQNCGICVNLRNQNSCCRRRKNSTRRSITYGGYVKSHILIQCYGMIDEGCRRLPTWHSGCYKVCGGCSDSCNNSSCGCASTCQSSTSACGCKCSATNFRRYLHCVGRRVSRCYRTKIIHTRQVCHPSQPPGVDAPTSGACLATLASPATPHAPPLAPTLAIPVLLMRSKFIN